MVRRRTDLGPAVPEQLARLVVSEWATGGDVWVAYDLWKAARLEWVRQHPDSILGDFLDVLKGCVAEKLRLARMEEGETE